MKIQHIDAHYDHDFDFISNPDGSCHFWFCSNQGVVLVYDEFSPEFGIWLCAECWQDFADLPMFVIVEDKRPKTGTVFYNGHDERGEYWSIKQERPGEP